MQRTFTFDIRKSRLAAALFRKRTVTVVRTLRVISFIVALLSFGLFMVGFYLVEFSEALFARVLGLTLLAVVLFIGMSLEEAFYRTRLMQPRPPARLKQVLENPNRYNLANFIDYKTARAFLHAEVTARTRRIPVSTMLLFLFLLDTDGAKFIFRRLGLDLPEVADKLHAYLKDHTQKLDVNNPLYTIDLQQAFWEAMQLAATDNRRRIPASYLLAVFAKKDPFFQKLIVDNEFQASDVLNLARLRERLLEDKERRSKFWTEESLAIFGSVGRDVSSGYTITLDQYAEDITRSTLQHLSLEALGHDRESEQLKRVLSRTGGNNVLLVGRPGSGRGRIIEAFARKSYFGQLTGTLNYQRVIQLNLPSLIAQIETLEQAEEVLDRVFRETAKAGNVILVIDEFHNYVSPVPRPGVLNISGLISAYLERAEFRVIAMTSYAGLHADIEKNPSLLNYFDKIEVRELTEDETLRVLEDWTPLFEERYGRQVLYPTMKHAIRMAARYLPDTAFPKKAIDLLDEVAAYAHSLPRHPRVLPEDVDAVVTEKTEIPVGKIKNKERETLLNLEQLIHRRIVNQEEAVQHVAKALRRARTDISVRKGPMGTFLFLGPTGVGKTETSKALSEIYFGSEERMIRMDMSEFQETKDIDRLLGSTQQEGLLTTQVRENPFSLILLDEIEKAHPNILNLFLQVLDEGYVTDGLGRKVNFKNSMIIATSNAGAQLIWEDVRHDKNLDVIREDLFSYFFEHNIYRPEFLNRFDAAVIFKPLTKEHLLEIADLLLTKLTDNLQRQEIELTFSPNVKAKIAELGYNPEFGAREMRRVIQDTLGNIVARALLEQGIKRGDRARLDLDENQEFTLTVAHRIDA